MLVLIANLMFAWLITLEVVDFLNSTVRYMDTLNWIERYAWFALFVSPLIPVHPIHLSDNLVERRREKPLQYVFP